MIDWIKEKPIIEKKLKNNEISITKLAKEYNISKPTFRKILKYLGYYGETKENLIKIRFKEGFGFLDQDIYQETKKYVLARLTENIFWGYDNNSGKKSLIHKKDFINLLQKTHKFTNEEINSDFIFEKLPEIFRKDEKIKFKVKIYTSIVTKEEVWIEAKKSFDECIVCHNNPKNPKFIKDKKISLKYFLLRVIDTHGKNKFDFSKVNFINYRTKVEIICKTCGKHFWINPESLISGEGCPDCSFITRGLKKFDTNEFIKRSELLYGKGVFGYDLCEYIDRKTPVRLIKLNTKELIKQLPKEHLKDLYDFSSRGESIIKYCLSLFNIKFKQETTIIGLLKGRKSEKIRIDFVLDNIKGKKYWIEYNGGQHYYYSKFYHKTKEEYKNQLKRDKNIKEYCKNNNIIFIEIPYTYKTIPKIKNILEEIIINNKDPEKVITIPKIKE